MNTTVPAESIEGPRTADTTQLAGLANRFLELFARRVPRQEFAAEVVRLVAEAVRVRVVAALAYDAQTDRLTLLADLGLSPEARAALGGDHGCDWDVPLNGLRNRRISVIAAAQRNPFVPRAIANISPRGLTIASLPIFHELQPVGVLILVAEGQRPIPDVLLQTLSQALRVCARGLQLVEAPTEIRPVMPAEPQAVEEVIARLVREGAQIEASELFAAAQPLPSRARRAARPRAAAGDEGLARLRKPEAPVVVARAQPARSREAARSLPGLVGRAAGEADGLEQELAQFEAARDAAIAEMRAQVDTLEQRLVAVDSARNHFQRRITALESERNAARERMRSAEARASELQAAMAVERQERERLSTEKQALAGQIRAAEETLARARSNHAAEIAALQAERERYEHEAAALHTDLDGRAARLAAVEQQLQDAIARRDGVATALQAASQELQQLVSERTLLTQRIGDLEDTTALMRVDRVALGSALQEERADRQRTEGAWDAERATIRQEAQRLAAEVGLRDERLVDLGRLLAARDEEVAGLQQARESALQAERTWQQTTAALRAELDTVGARLEQGGIEQQALRDEREALHTALREAREGAALAEVAHAAALAQAQGESGELRRQVGELSSQLVDSLREQERNREEGLALVRRLAEAEQRGAELSAAIAERDTDLTSMIAARDEAATRLSVFAEEADAARQELERDRAALEADRENWKQRADTLRTELARRRKTLSSLQQERDAALQSRDASHVELQMQHAEIQRLSAELLTLHTTIQDLDAARAAALQKAGAAHRALSEERAAHARNEQTLRADLETATVAAATQRDEIATLRSAVEDLTRERQTVEEREAASRARVAELEGQLGAASAQSAEAERQQAELATDLAATRQRAETIAQAHAGLEAELCRLREERDQLGSERAALDDALRELRAQVSAAHTEAERAVAEAQELRRTTQEQTLARTAAEHALAEWQERGAALEAGVESLRQRVQASTAENTQLREERLALEHQLTAVAEARGEETQALAQGLQAAREQVAQLEQERTDLRAALNEACDRADQAQGTARAARHELQERQTHIESLAAHQAASEAQWRQSLDIAQGELRETAQAAAALRAQLADREACAATLQGELETLRGQSAEHETLAQRASELGERLRVAEHELQAQCDAAAAAQQQSATLAEELDVARRQHAEAAATAAREQDDLRAAVERLSQERCALESERAAQQAAQEAAQAALGELRAAHAQLETEHHDAAQRLDGAYQQLEQLTTSVRQRDAALAAAANQRQQATQQISDLHAQLRAAQESLQATLSDAALERTALEADRDRWVEQAGTARAEAERLAATNSELRTTMTGLGRECDGRGEEVSTLRTTLEQERTAHHEVEQGLRAELLTVRDSLERTSQVADQLRQESSANTAATQQALADAQRRTATLEAEVALLRVRAEESGAECAQLRDARTLLERQLNTVAASRGQEAQTLAQGLQAARDQVRQLEQERAAMWTAVQEMHARAGQTEETQAAVRAALQAEVDATRAQLTELQAEHERARAAAAEAAHTLATEARVAETERQHAATLAERQKEIEAALATAVADREHAQALLVRTQAELESAHAQSADRDALVQRVQELSARMEETDTERRTLHATATEAEQQRTALAEELEAERDSLREALERLTQEHGRSEAERVAQRGELQAQRAAQDEMLATLEQLRAERAQREADGLDVAQRLAAAHRQLDELGQLLRQRDGALASAAEERQRLEEALSAAAADSTARLGADVVLQAETPEAEPSNEREQQVRRGEERSDFEVDAPFIIERSAPLDAVCEQADDLFEEGPAEPEAHATEAAPVGELVLLDAGPRGDEAASVLERAGFAVVRPPATDATVDDLERRKVSCVLLNLAGGPGAWQILKLLRERPGTQNIPVLAYLMPPQAQTGFCFGRADFGIWPMDPGRIIERLTRLKQNLKRLLAVSPDVDTMGRIRGPLAEEGVSTSIVLDGKQALEFVGIVAPDAALVHLSPQCSGSARAIGGLRFEAATRNAPLLVFLEKNPPREDAFYASSSRELIARPNFQFANLPAQLSALLI